MLLKVADRGRIRTPVQDAANVFTVIANQYWSDLCQKQNYQDELCEKPLLKAPGEHGVSVDYLQPSEAADTDEETSEEESSELESSELESTENESSEEDLLAAE